MAFSMLLHVGSTCNNRDIEIQSLESSRTSEKEKANQLLTHKLFEKAVNPRTTSRPTRRKCLFSWFRRSTHKLICPVNRPVVPESAGPSPEQKFMFICSFLSSYNNISSYVSCSPTFRLSISSCVFDRVLRSKNDHFRIFRSFFRVVEHRQESGVKPIEIAENRRQRFRMEGGAKSH